MHAIVLHRLGGDVGHGHVAEIGEQVNAQAVAVALHILGAALACSERLVFGEEFRGAASRYSQKIFTRLCPFAASTSTERSLSCAISSSTFSGLSCEISKAMPFSRSA